MRTAALNQSERRGPYHYISVHMVRELFNIEAHSQLARQQRSSGEKDQNDLNETFAIVNRSNQSSRVDNRNIVAT